MSFQNGRSVTSCMGASARMGPGWLSRASNCSRAVVTCGHCSLKSASRQKLRRTFNPKDAVFGKGRGAKIFGAAGMGERFAVIDGASQRIDPFGAIVAG